MKTILSIMICVLLAYSAQAQQRSYKHPYGLGKTTTTQTQTVVAKPTPVAPSEQAIANRNYKRPQVSQGESVVQALPVLPVETTTNPLASERNYKRQNRRATGTQEIQAPEDRIMAKDSTVIKE